MGSYIAERAAWIGSLLPGLALATVIGLLSLLVSGLTGTTPYLLAIVAGVTLARLGRSSLFYPGTTAAATLLLRIGIVLMASRLELSQVTALGVATICMTLLAVVVAGLLGFILARLLGLTAEPGLVLSGAVSICGASAAIALASGMDKRKVPADLLVAVLVTVTVLSTLAMFFYPLVAEYLRLDSRQSGILIGASIHDVAQVVGAGYAVSQGSGDTAVVIKMLRILLLIPGMLLAAIMTQPKSLQDQRNWAKWAKLPGFIWLFLLVFAVNSVGLVSSAISEAATSVSSLLFACALAAAGMRVSLNGILSCGWRPVVIMVAQSLVLLLLTATVAVLA